MYRILIFSLFILSLLSSCKSTVAFETAKIVSNVTIDEEINPVLDNILYLLGNVDANLKPDDINYESFIGIESEYNTLIELMGKDIQTTGILMYEDYKVDLLTITTDLEILSSKYPERSANMIPIIAPIIKDIAIKYARYYVGREFIRHYKY